MGRSPWYIEFGGYERTFYIFFFNFSLFIVDARFRRLPFDIVGVAASDDGRSYNPPVARTHGGRMGRGMARTAPDLVALCGRHQFAAVHFHAHSTVLIAFLSLRQPSFSRVRVTTSDDLRGVYDDR